MLGSFKKIFLCGMLGLLIGACQRPEDQFNKGWMTRDVDVESPTGIPSDSTSVLPRESYLRFYPEGRLACYTRRGNYQLMDWELSADAQTIYVNRQALALPALQLSVYTIFPSSWSARLPGSDSVRLFKFSTVFSHPEHDLLHPNQNKWRFKSTHRLAEAELKAKVAGHMQYAADYFDIVVKREQGYFEPRFLNLPVRFYQGAMGVQRFSSTPVAWRNLFYDDTEALKALAYYQLAFRQLRYIPQEKQMLVGLQKSFEKMATFLNE